MPDIDSMNQALDRALLQLRLIPQADDFFGTIRSAIFLAGKFIRAADGQENQKGGTWSPTQLRAMTEGAEEIFNNGRMVYGGFVLIVERVAVGVRCKIERAH